MWQGLLLLALLAGERVGDIEFFGYKGIEVAKVREALPVREGGEFTGGTIEQVRQAVIQATGKAPTDIDAPCCDEQGNRLLFIGLPGASSRQFTYNPPPAGDERLSPDIMDVSRRLGQAMHAAVRKGGGAASEDDSNGYALVKDPEARSLQLAIREWAVGHERELFRTLARSSSAEHRRVAADAAGYAPQSPEQIRALVRAARDPDNEVRNNATRALGVLMHANSSLGSRIPPDSFIEMLNSGIWSDRNKAAWLLMELTATHDPDLLAKIRSTALDSLVEMASWRRSGHAGTARVVLGRVAGIPEDRLTTLAFQGPVSEIIEAARQ